MHAPHIVLIDTRGTVMDYAVSTDILAQVFTLLQSAGERQDHPMLKPEYLDTGKPVAVVDKTPRPDIRDNIPSFLSHQDKAPLVGQAAPGEVIRLTGRSDKPSITRGDAWQDCVVETPEKPSEPDNASFMASLNSLFKNT